MGKCRSRVTANNPLMISQWLGAIKQQAIAWTDIDPDLCRHKASLGHSELKMTVLHVTC